MFTPSATDSPSTAAPPTNQKPTVAPISDPPQVALSDLRSRVQNLLLAIFFVCLVLGLGLLSFATANDYRAASTFAMWLLFTAFVTYVILWIV